MTDYTNLKTNDTETDNYSQHIPPNPNINFFNLKLIGFWNLVSKSPRHESSKSLDTMATHDASHD